MLPDFELSDRGKYEDFLESRDIDTFSKLCAFVRQIPYGRTSDRSKPELVFTENKGTCSSKHGILMEICEINGRRDIELIVGIFLMNESYSSKIAPVLAKYGLENIPEAHCYLRHEGKRYDFTGPKADPARFEPYLVREQRCDSQQVIDWKPMIHKHYIESWLKRKNLDVPSEKIWEVREECIAALG
ncbi:MAG: hypothetical protein K0R65_2423 [Crocinitomicaceae bacterium]|jgi:hypothetical protein|nr:hypothetical protein [Crocinitomicaceae bacterium]